MFDAIPGRVLLPSLNATDVRELFAAVQGGVQGRTASSAGGPLIVLDPHMPARHMAAVAKRLSSAPNLEGADVILASSGSSGDVPHLVKLSWSALVASATATAQYLGDPGTWVLSLPPHHIAGFQIIVRAALDGTRPVVLPRAEPEGLAAAVSGAAGRLLFISLVPTQLARLVAAPGGPGRLGEFHTVLVGGAHLAPALAKKSPPNLVTTYGMTETSGGCVYDGAPLPGVQVRVVAGDVFLGGPTLLSGYVDEPDPTIILDGGRWLVTRDRGHLVGGRLELLGRADDMIVSGGENVSAVAVANLIGREFPQLQEVQVVGVADEEWGQAVCAAISGGSEPASAIGPKIREAVRGELGAAAAPRHVVALPRFPLLSNGKVDRRALLATIERKIGGEEAWTP